MLGRSKIIKIKDIYTEGNCWDSKTRNQNAFCSSWSSGTGQRDPTKCMCLRNGAVCSSALARCLDWVAALLDADFICRNTVFAQSFYSKDVDEANNIVCLKGSSYAIVCSRIRETAH